MKAYRIKTTGEIFLTNYIDHYNGYISKGDYKNKILLKFEDVEEIEIERQLFEELEKKFNLI